MSFQANIFVFRIKIFLFKHAGRFADLQEYLKNTCLVSRKMDSHGVTGVACINDHINSSVGYIFVYWCSAIE